MTTEEGRPFARFAEAATGFADGVGDFARTSAALAERLACLIEERTARPMDAAGTTGTAAAEPTTDGTPAWTSNRDDQSTSPITAKVADGQTPTNDPTAHAANQATAQTAGAPTSTQPSKPSGDKEPVADELIPPNRAREIYEQLLDKMLTFIEKRRASLEWLLDRTAKSWRALFQRLGIDYWLQIFGKKHPNVKVSQSTFRWAREHVEATVINPLIGPNGELPPPGPLRHALEAHYPAFEQKALADAAAGESTVPPQVNATASSGAATNGQPSEESVNAVSERLARAIWLSELTDDDLKEPTNMAAVQAQGQALRSFNRPLVDEVMAACADTTDATYLRAAVEAVLQPRIADLREKVAIELGYAGGFGAIPTRYSKRRREIEELARKLVGLNLDDDGLKRMIDEAVSRGSVSRKSDR